MPADRVRVLAELPLPLERGAGVLEAIAIAVAVEDALGVTLPDESLDPVAVGQRASIESLLDVLAPLS